MLTRSTVAFVLLGVASGQSFNPDMLGPPQVLSGASLDQPIHATDFDGDGGVDLLAADQQHRGLIAYSQLPDGSYAPGLVSDLSAVLGAWRPQPADFDGDGLMDAAGLDVGAIVVRLGLGGGEFGVKHVSATPMNTWDTVLEAADFTGDGLTDGLVAGRGPQQSGIVLAAKGLGGGDLGSFGVLAVIRRPEQSLTADLDADGDLDVAFVEGDRERGLVVLLNPGNGLLAKSGLSLILDHDAVSNAADLDLDGFPDLVGFSPLGSGASVLFGDGKGGFSEQPLAVPLPATPDVGLSDLDGDGFPDLIASPGLSGFGHLLLQRLVRGLPHDELVQSTTGVGGHITTADTDGDGLREVIVAWSQFPGDSLRVYPNALGPFIDVGLGDPAGPQLGVSGQASPGGVVTVSLQPAFGHGPALLLAGVAPLLHVSPAGLVVPDPLILVPVSLPSSLATAWPAELVPGTLVYLQGVALGSPPRAGNAVVIVPQP